MTNASPEWRRPKKCAEYSCVEWRVFPDGNTEVRNSDDPATVLSFTKDEWDAFIGGVRLGEFDVPTA